MGMAMGVMSVMVPTLVPMAVETKQLTTNSTATANLDGMIESMNKHPPAKRVVLLMRAKPYVPRARVKRVSTVCQLRRIVTCRP